MTSRALVLVLVAALTAACAPQGECIRTRPVLVGKVMVPMCVERAEVPR